MNEPTIAEAKELNGKIFAMLTERENIVFEHYRRVGRKYGIAVSVINEADPEKLAGAKSQEEANLVMKSANSRVSVVMQKEVEISKIKLAVSKLYDFTLIDGTVQRLRYEDNGQWSNPVTGEFLEQLPRHVDFTHAV